MMGTAPTPRVQIDIPGTLPDGRLFLGWTPVQGTARVVSPLPGPLPLPGTVPVTLRNAGSVGKLRFALTRTGNGNPTQTLNLPISGAPVPFWVGGDIGSPSRDYGDAAIEVRLGSGTIVVGRRDLMVRVRKNAITLTPSERDRFLGAMGTLNGSGLGRFRDFRAMHTPPADREEHGDCGFLSWHRAYLLDLERELQAIDPRVALPYWRFDQPAPQLFTVDYMGATHPSGFVQFKPGHPFGSWVTDGTPGVLRTPRFNTANAPPVVFTEATTLGLGTTFFAFKDMEGNPHGQAHVSYSGFIRSPGTAPRDPLFFLLHCNVDRLWAKWQVKNVRHDPAVAQSFFNGTRVGHRLNDSMWPWNGSVVPPRPNFAPGGPLAPSPSTSLPGGSPMVRSMLDYQGKVGGIPLVFDYDDVPFAN
jgi:tyrosinase